MYIFYFFKYTNFTDILYRNKHVHVDLDIKACINYLISLTLGHYSIVTMLQMGNYMYIYVTLKSGVFISKTMILNIYEIKYKN